MKKNCLPGIINVLTQSWSKMKALKVRSSILSFICPGRLKTRDAVFRRSKLIDEKDQSISYSIQALPELLPVKKDKIRVLMIRSIWRFTPLPDGKTEIYFQQHCNPGGSIPAFLVNGQAVDTAFNSLKNLRQLIMETH